MSENHAPTTLSPAGVARGESERSVPVRVPPPPRRAAGSSSWTAGRIAAIVVGALLGLFSVVLLGASGTMLWADITQRDGSYITTDAHGFSTAGSALVTTPADLGAPGVGWLYSPSMLGEIRIRVAPTSADSPLFVGIAPSAEVDRYLEGVSHTVISDFWTDTVQPAGGGVTAAAPGSQDFWVASDTGPGPRTLTWEATGGSWTVVVMNADARPGVDVRADLGATMPPLLGVGVGLLVAGGVFLTGAILLIVGAIRRRAARATA